LEEARRNFERLKEDAAEGEVQRLKTLMDSAQISSDELFRQLQKAYEEQNTLKVEAKRMKEVLKVELDAVRVKECYCILNICCLEKGTPTEAVAFLGTCTKTLKTWRDPGGPLQKLRILQTGQIHISNFIDKIKEKYYMSP
jgi:hypothetical protein